MDARSISIEDDSKLSNSSAAFSGETPSSYPQQRYVRANRYSQLSVGDKCLFGTYNEQPIPWLVIDVQDDIALLLSEFCIDKQQYDRRSSNVGAGYVRWRSSDLRHWLNKDFYRAAFDPSERKIIVPALVGTLTGEMLNSMGKPDALGNQVGDHVFCLSIDEAQRYFVSDMERRDRRLYESVRNYLESKAVEYELLSSVGSSPYGKIKTLVMKKRAQDALNAGFNMDGWWLRDGGKGYRKTAFVVSDGSINAEGINGVYSLYVRPAIWIRTERPIQD